MVEAAPKISVIIPAFNAARWLAGAIESALKQTLSPLEVIVVDDGSTDGTSRIISCYGPPVKTFRIDNSGVGAARNLGMQEASGEWLAFLDSDDKWAPDKLQRVMEHAARIPGAALFSHDAFVLDESDEVAGIYFFRPAASMKAAVDLVKGNWVMTSTVVMRTGAAREVGGFRTDLKKRAGCEDWDYWIRTAAKFQILHIPLPLTYYRRMEGSATRSGLDDLLEDSLRVVEENGSALGIPEAEMRVARAGAYRRSAVRRMAAFDISAARTELGKARGLDGGSFMDLAASIILLSPIPVLRGIIRIKRAADSYRGRRAHARMGERSP